MAFPYNRRRQVRNDSENEQNGNHRPMREDDGEEGSDGESFAEWREKVEFTWKVFVSLCAGFGAVLFGVIELLRFAKEMGWLD